MPRIFGYQITSADVLRGPLTLSDNVAIPQNLITYDITTVNYMQLQYSLIRNGLTVSGRLLVTTDGTNVSIQNDDITTNTMDNGDLETAINLGISFNASIQGSAIVIQYTSTSTGFSTIMKWYEKTWI